MPSPRMATDSPPRLRTRQHRQLVKAAKASQMACRTLDRAVYLSGAAGNDGLLPPEASKARADVRDGVVVAARVGRRAEEPGDRDGLDRRGSWRVQGGHLSTVGSRLEVCLDGGSTTWMLAGRVRIVLPRLHHGSAVATLWAVAAGPMNERTPHRWSGKDMHPVDR